MRSNKLLPVTVFSICTLMCVTAQGAKQDQENEENQEKANEQIPIRVLVVDPEGEPIPGAIVRGGELGTSTRRNTIYQWTAAHGEKPKVVTDEQGIAHCHYPRHINEEIETTFVRWYVEHPDFFLRFGRIVEVSENPSRIVMERGYRIAVTAIDEATQQPIKDHLFALASGEASGDWELKSNGTLVSMPIADQRTVLRVMRIVEGEPTLFSDRITIEPTGRSRVLLSNLELKPGARVEGKLDDSTPRPIRNGYVAAGVVVRPDENPQVPYSRWSWTDKATIDEDGTFVFESLPHDEILQMLPFCDGYAPTKPTAAEIHPFFPFEVRRAGTNHRRIPQCVRLEGDVTKVTLKMEPCSQLRVAVVDPDQQPLAHATVAVSPMQDWFESGSQRYGAVHLTTEQLLLTRAGKEIKFDEPAEFQAVTDERGIATLSGLPGGSRHWVYVIHNEYEAPESGDQQNPSGRFVDVSLKPGETTETKVKMQLKENESMNEENDG